jgi:hypothetical protein
MDIANEHHYAVALAGTVALPSPYPAYGQAFFVLSDWEGDTVIYVKLVQNVSKKQIVTWHVKPGEIRAIRLQPPGGSNDPESWPILSPAKTRKEIAAGETAIIAHAKEAGVKSLEEPWHPAVILYVPEAAPVLFRHEVAMTAAESVESPLIPAIRTCCG